MRCAKCPVNKISDRAAERVIDNCTRHLRREIALLNPRRIAIIKKTNRPLVGNLQDWGFADRLVSHEPLAFPAAGNQVRFRAEMAGLRARYPELRSQLGAG
ncbi:MAG: hypothetical protein M0Z94_13305 [Dehalococcoidales bacterium]|nr:hypothetical protein [Dehalococcoidales bacterium]